MFTPYSSGLINILTASSPQLQMIPLVDEHVAGEIMQLREEGNGPGWFAAVPLAGGFAGQYFAGPAIGAAGGAVLHVPQHDFRSAGGCGSGPDQAHLPRAPSAATVPNDIQILSLHWK